MIVGGGVLHKGDILAISKKDIFDFSKEDILAFFGSRVVAFFAVAVVETASSRWLHARYRTATYVAGCYVRRSEKEVWPLRLVLSLSKTHGGLQIVKKMLP